MSEYLFAAYLALFGSATILIGVLGTGRSGRVFLVVGTIVVVLADVLALDEYHSVEVK